MVSLYKSSWLFTVLKVFVFATLYHVFGLIFTLIAYFSGYFIFQYIVNILFKWEPVGLDDLIFIETDIGNDYLCIGAFYLEKINPKGIKEKIIERGVKKISKMRQVPFTIFNNWYFYELPSEVALSKANRNIKFVSDKSLKDRKNLQIYAAKEMKKLFPKENELLWEIQLIDFEDEKGGILLFKMDHLMTDATGMMNIYALLIDNFETVNYSNIPRNYSLWDFIKFYFKIPYYLLFIIWQFHLEKYETSPFRDNQSINPNQAREVTIISTQPYEFADFYKKFKELKVSFNDLILLIFAKSLKNYYKEKGFSHKKNLMIGVTVGPQSMPTDRSKIVVKNLSTCVFVNVDFIDNIVQEAESFSLKIGKTTRNKDMSRFMSWMVSYINLLFPRSFSKEISKIGCHTVDFILSNVPGPKESIYFDGCKVTSCESFPPLGYNKAFCTLFTYNGKLYLQMTFDKTLNIDEEELISCIEKEINDLIYIKSI